MKRHRRRTVTFLAISIFGYIASYYYLVRPAEGLHFADGSTTYYPSWYLNSAQQTAANSAFYKPMILLEKNFCEWRYYRVSPVSSKTIDELRESYRWEDEIE